MPSVIARHAALVGVACSMRAFSGPAVLAARGRVPASIRRPLMVLAVGELVWDKCPFATDRILAPALLARVGSGAYTGYAVGAWLGTLTGAASAGAGAFATWRLRRLATGSVNVPAVAIGVAEDLIAYGTLAALTRAGAAAGGGAEG